MANKTEICNMAISHLGNSSEIANVDTESSQEASACRRFYETAKNATLTDVDWPFATAYFTLNLIEETPDDEWNYSYRYPVGCLSVRRILSGTRNDSVKSREPYKILKDASGKLIYADKENAKIEYTEDISDPEFFSAEFALALSFRLASYIAPRLTGGDPFKMKQEMLGQYDLEINRAKKKAFNEEQHEQPPKSELITTRS